MNLPYRYRGVALLALLLLVLPWVAWRFALRDTWAAWRDCRRLSALLAETPGAVSEAAPTMLSEPEVICSGVLLDAVREAAAEHSVQVTGYEPRETFRGEGLAVHTARLTLTGGCKPLLQVTAALETALPDCRLRTLEWRTATDRRTRRTDLVLTLYIEQIIRLSSKP